MTNTIQSITASFLKFIIAGKGTEHEIRVKTILLKQQISQKPD